MNSQAVHTFDIPTTVNGDFYIKIKYYIPDYRFIIQFQLKILKPDYANPVIDTSVNWVSPDGINWESCNPDTADDGQNLTIRAYAVKLDITDCTI